MPYSKKIVSRARQILESRKADWESKYRDHLHTAYQQVPRLRQIDMQLRSSMAVAAQTVFSKGIDAAETMEQVKKDNLALQQERQALIREHFSPEYLDDSPLCKHCGGTGYIGAAMCWCLEKLCRQEQRKELDRLTDGNDRFENFRLDYYPDRADNKIGVSPRAIMERNFKYCQQYAAVFPEAGNLLFVGSTGLGKTFLSACIANAVMDKGVSIVYESAPHLFAKLEKNRFNPDEESREAVAEIENCQLLILDDLGTEMPGNFVTAALYSLLNDRLLANRAMIISTNLNIDEIARRYSPQIASRLQGSFRQMPFVGQDIRVLKNKGI